MDETLGASLGAVEARLDEGADVHAGHLSWYALAGSQETQLWKGGSSDIAAVNLCSFKRAMLSSRQAGCVKVDWVGRRSGRKE